MNPELLNRLRQLLTGQPAAPRDQTRVAAAEDMNFAEEERRQMAKGKHSPRFHDEGFARLTPAARTEAVRQHIAEQVSPTVREGYLTPSADSVFRSAGLPSKLAETDLSGAEAVYNPSGDVMAVRPQANEADFRRSLIHESRHRAQDATRGFVGNKQQPAEFNALVPYLQRQPEQYAFLGQEVYTLLTDAAKAQTEKAPSPNDMTRDIISRDGQSWYSTTTRRVTPAEYAVARAEYDRRQTPEWKAANLQDKLRELDARYPKSPASAEAIARDLLAGRTTARGGQIGSIFGPEHPLRKMLGVPARRIVGLP